jgi:nitrogen fixation/metabolism regulation signal transduction histidine kinase
MKQHAEPLLSPAARWAWTLTLLAVAAASGVLAYLLSIGATTPSGFIERHQGWLYWVNLGVGAVLGLVVLGAALRLLWRVRRGRFGAQLLGKMALVFALVAALPGALIYAVSFSFVERSIESWFDVRLASALEAGLNLGRATLDDRVQTLAEQTRQGAQQLVEQGSTPLMLERLRERLGAERVALLGAGGQVLTEVRNLDSPAAAPVLGGERIDATLLRRAGRDGAAARLDGLDEEGARQVHLRALALLPATALSLAGGDRYLLVEAVPPRSLVDNALAVQAANQAYQRRALERDGLRRMYLGTLTLVLVLAVFLALLLAIQLGNQLAKPLLLLADGMRQVAAGDLTRKPVLANKDELGGLTRAFADMTDQLGSARAQADQSLAALTAARAELQTILDNLTAGVIVLDAQFAVVSANPSATRILRQPLASSLGQPLRASRRAGRTGGAHRAALRHPGRCRPGSLAAHRRTAAARRQRTADPAAARCRAAPAAMAAGVRRRQRGGQRAAQCRLGRGGAPPGARDQEPPDTDPAQRRAPADAPVAQARRRGRPRHARPLGRHHRQAGRCPQDPGQRLPRLRAPARRAAGGAGSQRPGGRGDGALPGRTGRRTAARRARSRACRPCSGDASQLRQVIHNLVQNGLDAVSERPDGRVVVSTRQSRGEDGSVRALRLALSDNGPGFADAVLRRAFRTLCDHQEQGHRSRAGGGEEDRRRAWRPHPVEQQRARDPRKLQDRSSADGRAHLPHLPQAGRPRPLTTPAP